MAAKRKPAVQAAPAAGRLPVRKTYKLYIGGAFPRSESGRSLTVKDAQGDVVANICRASRKDVRDAVTAARTAFGGWSGRAAYNRGQILYRMAEMVEGRRAQFIAELTGGGVKPGDAAREVDATVDRLVHYAGWADKFQQVFSSVNPVNSPHFNFSILEPTGVVGVVAPRSEALLGLVSLVAPAICGGNTVIALASPERPLPALTLAEALHASDLPGGVVNILSGLRSELLKPLASHLDVNAVVYAGEDPAEVKLLQIEAAGNVKRVVNHEGYDWFSPEAQGPYFILETSETKTTWHPIGL